MRKSTFKKKRVKVLIATENGEAIINEDLTGSDGEEAHETNAQKEINEALKQTSLLQQKKKTRKKWIFRGGYAGGIGLVGYLVYWLFAPAQGGIWFSLCKTFLELNVKYPQYLSYSTTDWFDTSVRIWFTQLDGFGQYRMEPIQCYFKEDPEMGYALERVTISRREMEPQKIEAFNKSSYVFLTFPPDDTMPYPLSDSLEGLQFQTDKFRIQLQ